MQEYQKVNLDFNGSKIRWLTDSKVTPTDTFCIGSNEKRVLLFIFISAKKKKKNLKNK